MTTTCHHRRAPNTSLCVSGPATRMRTCHLPLLVLTYHLPKHSLYESRSITRMMRLLPPITYAHLPPAAATACA
eukprot:595124-Pelagomonas_calceolata.AAC.8